MKKKYKQYGKELKIQAVEAYMEKGSLRGICREYGISEIKCSGTG